MKSPTSNNLTTELWPTIDMANYENPAHNSLNFHNLPYQKPLHTTQTQTMQSTDWVTFLESTNNFDETFKVKLSDQLKNELDIVTGVDNIQSQGFQILFGLIPLAIQSKNFLGIASCELITPDSYGIAVQFSWWLESHDKLDILELPYQDVSDLPIKFSWFGDFPVDKIKYYAKPRRVIKKKTSGLSFNIEYYFDTYPDVSFEFYFKRKVSHEYHHQFEKCVSEFKVDYNLKNKSNIIKYLGEIINFRSRIIEFTMDFGFCEHIVIDELLEVIHENFPCEISKVQIR